MSTRSANYIFLLVLLIYVVGIAFVYSSLPDRMASHWNAAGEVDGYMARPWAIAILPLVLAVIYLLYWLLPKLDPLRENIESFRTYLNLFWVSLCIFFAYIFALTVAWNLGARFVMTYWVLPALAALWYLIGVLTERSKRNWFIGIRTPWTLSSDEIWRRANALGGKLFKLLGLLTLAVIPFTSGASAFIVIVVAAIAIVLFSFLYSYVLFARGRNSHQ